MLFHHLELILLSVITAVSASPRSLPRDADNGDADTLASAPVIVPDLVERGNEILDWPYPEYSDWRCGCDRQLQGDDVTYVFDEVVKTVSSAVAPDGLRGFDQGDFLRHETMNATIFAFIINESKTHKFKMDKEAVTQAFKQELTAHCGENRAGTVGKLFDGDEGWYRMALISKEDFVMKAGDGDNAAYRNSFWGSTQMECP